MDRVFDRIVKNSASNVAGRILLLVMNLLMIPYIISKIGIRGYGVWVLLYAFTNCFNLFDLGISSSYTRFIAEERAKGAGGSVSSIVANGFYMNLAFSFVFFAIGFLLKDFFILKILKAGDIAGFSLLYVAVLAIFSLNYAFGIFRSVLDGFQRMELTNVALVASKLVELAGIFILLMMDHGLAGIVLAVFIGRIIFMAALFGCSKFVFRKLSLSLKFINLAQIKRIMAFGWKVQITNLSCWVNRNLDKLLIAYLLNIPLVAFYDLAQRITDAARNLCASFIGPIIPAASEVNTIGDEASLKKLFFKSMKLLLFVSIPLFFLIFISARGLTRLWLGEGYARTAVTLTILAVGAFVNILTGVGTSIARGVNKPFLETRYAILNLVLNVSLSVIFIIRFGFYGAAVGTTLASVISSLYFLFIFFKEFNIPLKGFMDKKEIAGAG